MTTGALVSVITLAVCLLAAVAVIAAHPVRLLPTPSTVLEPEIALQTRRVTFTRVGALVRRRTGQPKNDRKASRLGRAIVLGGVAALAAPVLGAVVAACSIALSIMQDRRLTQASSVRVANALAETIDLFSVALHSGHTVTSSVAEVSDWVDGDVGEAFRWCVDQTTQGRALSDALAGVPEKLGSNGEALRPLVAALVANERHGAPVAQSLAQLAADTRAEQRRRAEAAARRLPVSLLFPLVVCVLPAFLLLTVVPVIADSVTSFGLFVSPG